MNLSKLNKARLEEMKACANFTEDEEIVFDMLSKGKSIIQIADVLNLSTRSVDRRIRDIKAKLNM